MTVAFRSLLPVLAWLALEPAQAAFIDNGDGTVTDTVTALVWDKCSWGQSGNTCAAGAATTYTWQQALGVAVTANAGAYKGYVDWRLPNEKELESLADVSRTSPAIDTAAFPNTVSSWYWTSTISADAAGSWFVHFDDSYSSYGPFSQAMSVRLVRGGQFPASFDLLVAPPAITTGAPAAGSVGAGYAFTVTATGTGPITYAAAGLPPGLAINATTGAITGTPTAVGSHATTVTVNSAGGPATANYSIAVAAAAAIASVPTLSTWGLLAMSMLLAAATARRQRCG